MRPAPQLPSHELKALLTPRQLGLVRNIRRLRQQPGTLAANKVVYEVSGGPAPLGLRRSACAARPAPPRQPTAGDEDEMPLRSVACPRRAAA